MSNQEKTELFKTAHKIARRTSKLVGNYRLAFKLALKNLWRQIKFSNFEWELGKKGLLFTKESPIHRLSKMARYFYNNKNDVFSVRKAIDFLDDSYFDVGMSLSDKKYLAFCSVFNEQKVNEWLGIE
jgi:hypothetical protein